MQNPNNETLINSKVINQIALNHLEYLFPDGIWKGDEYFITNSLSINRITGLWCDRAIGASGDGVISLYRYYYNIDTDLNAAKEIATKLTTDNKESESFDKPSTVKSGRNNPLVCDPFSQESTIPIEFPGGLVGEIADYIYRTSKNPLKEAALLASIGLIAGISARSFNISDTGLNVYLMLVCETGRGKNSMKEGLDRIKNAVYKNDYKEIRNFTGAASPRSGAALLRDLAKKPCQFSVFGEFGHTLDMLNDTRAQHYHKELAKVYLDLYSSSGNETWLDPMIYADDSKNTESVRAPCFSFLGESNPKRFYGSLTPDNISDGLLSRLVIIEYKGLVKYLNSDDNTSKPVPQSIIEGVSRLVSIASTKSNDNDSCTLIDQTNDAKEFLIDYMKDCVDKVNELPKGSPEIALWRRAHLNTLKLAGIVAVGIDPISPVVDIKTAVWAAALLDNSINYFIENTILTGNINDTSCSAQEMAIRKLIEKYLKMSYKQRTDLKVSSLYASETHLVPHSYLRNKGRTLAAFKNDSRKETRALKETIEDMVANDVLREVKLNIPDNRLKSAIYEKGECW